MLTISENLRKSLVKCYLYANTPGYLFRRLRSLEGLTHLAQGTTTDTIIEHIDLLLESLASAVGLQSDGIAIDQLLEIYALIVVLSYKSDSAAMQAFQRLAKINLDWIGHVSRYALNMRVPSNTVHISMEQIRQFPTVRWDSSNTQTEIKYNYEPEITVTGG